jgi:hypothetical protein
VMGDIAGSDTIINTDFFEMLFLSLT